MFTSTNDTQISNERNTSSVSPFVDDGTPFPALRRAARNIISVAMLGFYGGLLLGSRSTVVVAALIAIVNAYALWKLSFHTSNEDPREAQKCPPSTYWFACDTWLHALRIVVRSSFSDPHWAARWVNWAVRDTVRCVRWHLRHAVVVEGLCDGLCSRL